MFEFRRMTNLNILPLISYYISNMKQYQVIKQLGAGSFGRVAKVRKHGTNEFAAMKQIQMSALSAKQRDSALNEIRLLASINSPNVIQYKTAFFDEQSNQLCIVMEYADGGDLAGLIQKKTEKEQKFNQNFIWQVAYDILKGLKVLHANKILHRDIKPGNIFFVDGVAKLGDLNISKVMESNFASTQAGTPYYTSPQIWSGQLYDDKCDVWSLGCLLYQIAALRPPFMANDFPSLSRKIQMGYYDPIPIIYSKKLAQTIKKCLIVRQHQRPPVVQLLKDNVFEFMGTTQDGQINLLSTIKCPNVLKLMNNKLPQCKSSKKIPTLKNIESESKVSPKQMISRVRSQQKPILKSYQHQTQPQQGCQVYYKPQNHPIVQTREKQNRILSHYEKYLQPSTPMIPIIPIQNKDYLQYRQQFQQGALSPRKNYRN